MNEPVVPLRSWLDVPALASASGNLARLLWIGPGPRVGGIVKGLAQVTVRATQGATSRTAAATPAAGGYFEAAFATAAAPGPMLLEALDAQGAVLDTVAYSPAGAPLQLPSAHLASLDAARFRFLAGSSDRVIERRAFSLLAYGDRLGATLFPFEEIGLRSGKDMHVVKGVAFRKALAASLQAPLAKVRANRMTTAEFEVERAKAVRAAIANASARPNAKEKRDWDARFATLRAPAIKGKGRPAVKRTPGPGPRLYAFGGRFVGIDDDSRISQDILDELAEGIIDRFRYEDFGGRVGMLFHDRARFRPAGLVVGEPVYTLSLLPEEEVQLRQVVETKRRGVLETIRDREEERTLSLNATWSTDVSEGMTESTNRQSAFDTSGDVSLAAGKVPIGAGLNLSSSASEAHENAAEWSTQTTQQASAQATARQRSQHKVRMEITTEDSASLGSTRTVRNANKLRSATHVFSKIYRREHATLERHDAQLCLRLKVDDPSASFRGSFLAGLDKIDPDNPACYESGSPGKLVTQLTKQLEPVHRYTIGGGGGLLNNLVETTDKVDVELEIKFPKDMKQADGTALPANYVLARTPSIRLASFVRFDTGGKHLSDPEATSTSISAFKAMGGEFRWDTTKTPKAGQSTTTGRVKGTAVTTTYARGFDEFFWGIRDIEVTVSAEWVPTTTSQVELQARHDARRIELVAALEEGAVQKLREAVDVDFQGAVIADAARAHLNYPAGFDLDLLRHIFDFEHAIVETVPYWATEQGRERYADLKARIEALPVSLPAALILNETLTTPEAVVYLPVKAGAERQALALLSGISTGDRNWVAAEVGAFRARFHRRPVETGHSYCCTPSNQTVIF